MLASNDNDLELNELLRLTGRSFALTARLLPKKIRYPITIGYLLARATDTIADILELPTTTRLHMLDDLIALINHGINAEKLLTMQSVLNALPNDTGVYQLFLHIDDVIKRLHAMPADTRQLLIQTLNTIAAGQRTDIERFPPNKGMCCLNTAKELDEYTYAVAGSVGEFWTRLSVNKYPPYSTLPADKLYQYAIHFGKGLQLVNILQDLPQDLAQQRCYVPLEFLHQQQINPDDLAMQPEKLAPITKKLWDQALQYLQDGWLYMLSIKPIRLRFAVAATLLFEFATLHKLQDMHYLSMKEPIKISRAQLGYLTLLAAVGSLSPSLFKILLRGTPYASYIDFIP